VRHPEQRLNENQEHVATKAVEKSKFFTMEESLQVFQADCSAHFRLYTQGHKRSRALFGSDDSR